MVNETKNLKLKQQQYSSAMVNNGQNQGPASCPPNNTATTTTTTTTASSSTPSSTTPPTPTPSNQEQQQQEQLQQSQQHPSSVLTSSSARNSLQTAPLSGILLHRPSPIKKVTIISAKSEELIAATPSERNWRGILIALLVIVAVLGMIVFSIVLVSPIEEGPRVKGRRPTLQETLQLQRLANKPFNGSWISGE
ncbi:exocyst complex component 5-like [Chrysoperla carnea]|uniref:exocyst complex component 5-like n=1 Tax=Chrysoperla carnea TaxID=189513 RepID=UPI001D06346D|nr:exocyst complex component 5-like [Chrysoperla carnea]